MLRNIIRFNVRIYGILLNDQQHVLVSDELIRGEKYTKFPGGGLEFGEGTKDCLIREFQEETGITISIREHLFTTDTFIPSTFDNDSQVLCIYYLVESQDWQHIETNALAFDFSHGRNENFRWVALDQLQNESTILLPTDKSVVQILERKKF